jgi:nicotinate phosphoribosyltransferase
MKLAEGKITLPGRKQVWRQAQGDVLGLHDEDVDGRPLLVPVMVDGRRLPAGSEDLAVVRERCRAALAGLPPVLRSLDPVADPETSVWPVQLGAGLRALAADVRAELIQAEAS